MDNLLIVPSVRDSEWVQEVMPGASPAELPVAGRRVIEYMLEHSEKFSVMFREILDWHYSKELAKDFSDMTRTGYPVFYARGEGEVPKGLADIEGLSTPLTQHVTDELVVAWGPLISMHTPEDVTLEPISEEERRETPSGLYRHQNGRWMRMSPHGLVIRNIKAWYKLNFTILHHPQIFTLPGYSAEKDVHIGRSVVLERGTKVNAPVLLQDNTWFARNVTLDRDVIVGSGSFVAEGATLSRTVVCDNTYIGEGLELCGKIVMGNRIIDAETGAWTDVDDPGVARLVVKQTGRLGLLRRIWRFLRGRSSGRRG